ncbi:hypothetical protein ElyMa_002494000 [Elysia marginata]|uniref:Uncharacterized protein n=1 Tax=Elysia marginata TaxID=1093978 RepID=A0AAV4GNW0_9GAST|nr:hypothetical protein ElyMa_002494000 [Elysia marginata]
MHRIKKGGEQVWTNIALHLSRGATEKTKIRTEEVIFLHTVVAHCVPLGIDLPHVELDSPQREANDRTTALTLSVDSALLDSQENAARRMKRRLRAWSDHFLCKQTVDCFLSRAESGVIEQACGLPGGFGQRSVGTTSRCLSRSGRLVASVTREDDVRMVR